MAEEMKKCPFCDEEILAVAKKCKHCGEWLDGQNHDTQAQQKPQTKTCPFCAEEIPADATVCPCCDEALNNDSTTADSSANSSLSSTAKSGDIEESWKKRFSLIEKHVIDGISWKIRPEFQNLSNNERVNILKGIYFSDILSLLSVLIFTYFYYFVKGMWQKGIVYGLALWFGYYLFGVFAFLIYFILFFLQYPYDYYRFKVLNKQW